MDSTLATVFLLNISVAAILLLITALDWVSKPLISGSTIIVSPHPGTSVPEKSGSERAVEYLPPKTTPTDGGVEAFGTNAQDTTTSPTDAGSKLTAITSSPSQRPKDYASEPTTTVPTSQKRPIEGVSNPAITSNLLISPPNDHKSSPSAKPPRIKQTTAKETHREQQEKGRAHVVEDILNESQAAEQEDGDSTAAVEKLPAKSQAFEVAIRGLVDPNGNSGSSLEKVVELVAGVLKSGREAEVKLESETVRFDRAIEDLGHEWMDKREQFEFIINGQNDMVYEKGVEANRLFRENTTLLSKNSKAEKKLQDLLVEYNGHLRTLVAEKRYAEDAEKKALNEVEDRINVQRRSYEQERSDREFQHLQAMNAQICSKRMVQDEFKRTQDCLRAAEKQFQQEMRRKDRTIQELEAEVSRRAAAMAAEEEHAYSSSWKSNGRRKTARSASSRPGSVKQTMKMHNCVDR